MELQKLISSNCQLLSLVNFHPKLWAHRLPSLKNPLKQSLHLRACLATKSRQKNDRPPSDFPPSVWKDLDNLSTTSLPALQEKQMEELKEKVKGMLMASANDPAQKLILINSLCCLGVSYHFDTEIDEQLNDLFESQPSFVDENDYDLYTVALIFRVFRQHGYKISCDVFNKFKDSDGKFKEVLTSDARGMLSLYEATHLRLHGEDILEEAYAFTMAHLSSLAPKSSPHLAEQIINALDLPMHKGIPRVETRKFISFYEDLESRDEALLLFAKLDFNRVQLLHRAELDYMKSWWNDLDFASKLPYARDRIVELYFLMAAVYFEPRYSRARIILSKVVKILSLFDDTFDSYGTLEELRLFTNAIQRWDASALDELPEYMKVIYSATLDTFDEMNDEATKEGRSYSVSYTKEAAQEMVRAYLQEIEWHHEGYEPSFDEYLGNSFITGGAYSIPTAIFVGMGEVADIEAFKWLRSKPKILQATFLLARLIDDTVPYESEQTAGKRIPAGVEIYMRQYGTSRDETVRRLKKMFEDAWKDITEECMKPTVVSTHILMRLVNFARISEFTYNGNDRYSNPDEHFKAYITALYFNQIPVQD